MSSRRPEALQFDFDAPADEAGVPAAPAAPGLERSAPTEATAAPSVVPLAAAPPWRRREEVGDPGSTAGEERPDPTFAPKDPRAASVEHTPGAGGRREVAAEVRGSDAALSVAEFYDRVRGALARALPGEVWVTGEIRKVTESKGHRYLELADHHDSGARPAQQLEVVCWSREWVRIGRELARAGVSLEPGRVVRVRGKVGVWEGAGKLRLQMTALDVEALLGGIAVARQRLLRQLGEEGLLEANRRLPLTPVPLRVGLVTSQGSEAHRDFAGRLERSGFAFELRVERSLVQGTQAPWQIAAAIRRLGRAGLDLIVVVRGGGGRGDLAAFDSEPVARAVAAAPVPVWVGVGHSGDRSVADEVAHASFITPTACGEAVVARVEAYWAGVLASASTLALRASTRLAAAGDQLARTRSFLSRHVSHQLVRRDDALAVRRARLEVAVTRRLEADGGSLAALADRLARCGHSAALEEAHGVRRCRDVLRAYDPQRQLERGWSLTRDASGRLLRSVGAVASGELVRTTLADGELSARVEAVVARDDGAQNAAPAVLPAATGGAQR